MGFPTGLVVKNLLASAGDTGDSGSIPGSGRSPGEKMNGQRSPQGCKEWDTTEATEHAHTRQKGPVCAKVCSYLTLHSSG